MPDRIIRAAPTKQTQSEGRSSSAIKTSHSHIKLQNRRRYREHGVLNESSILGRDTLPVLEDRVTTRINEPVYPTSLLGNCRTLPVYYLGSGYQTNSYFAHRLRDCVYLITLLDLIGIIYYYVDIIHVHGNFLESFMFQPSQCAPHTKCDSNCPTVIIYATLIYHMLPINIITGLPASGWRVFEPFYREKIGQFSDKNDARASMTKISRSFFLQICELMGVLVLVFDFVALLYFCYSLIKGKTFACSKSSIQLYAFGAFIVYCLTFVELQYFARFREHIKMHLGAFKEGDQSGNVRAVLGMKCTIWRTRQRRVSDIIRKQLYSATKHGLIKQVENVLAHGQQLYGEAFPARMYAAPTIRFMFFAKSKKNPLHIAAQAGNLAAMELLYQANFTINSFDKVLRVRFSTGDLFLYFAKFFVSRPDRTYDESATNIFKSTLVTPLHCAVARGQIEAVKWLIEHGADVNVRSKSSYWSERVPPLFLADDPEILRMLLRAGANHLDVPDPGRMNTLTVLQLAYLRGHIPIAYELEEWGGDVALTPLHTAAASNKVGKVRKLLKLNADPNCLGEQGYHGLQRRTPLHWAAVNGMLAASEILLHHGADPNFQDSKGRTPLHWAARTGRYDVLKLLVDRGADVHLKDSSYMTPLHCAALYQHTKKKTVKYLTAAGAIINELLENGDTPLHIAVKKEHLKTALSLLSCGADLMMTNKDGFRPLDCTTSAILQYKIKRAAGNRDVMISYTHSHSEFARRLRKSLEDASITTWLDLMDPSGIGGGAVWREEIARGIVNAVLVVAIVTEDYSKSEWCLKELAVAGEVGTPVVAVTTEGVVIEGDLSKYLKYSQILPFEKAILEIDVTNPRDVTYKYDNAQYDSAFRQLLLEVQKRIDSRSLKRATKLSQRRLKSISNKSLVAQMEEQSVFYMTGNTDIDDLLMASDFLYVVHGGCNLEFVQRLSDQLCSNGFRVCIEGLAGGMEPDDTSRLHLAKRAIDKCAAILPILSRDNAKNPILRSQIMYAEEVGCRIIPVMLNLLKLGLDKRYTFSRIQLYHFTTDAGFASSLNYLVIGLQQHTSLIPEPIRDPQIPPEDSIFTEAVQRQLSSVLSTIGSSNQLV